MKKLTLICISTFIISLLAACGSSNEETVSSGISLTLRYGHSAPTTDPGGIIADKIAEDVSNKTDGKAIIEVFPSSQLGGEVEMVEQLRTGSIDMAFVTGGALSNFVPDIAVLDLPFLFRDLDHAHKTLSGEVGEDLVNQAAEEGFQLLGFFDYGEGHLANNKREIHMPEDLKGLKMRTLENDIFMDTFTVLGADPVPMPFPELYSSIQQGVVDGTDPVNVAMTGGKLYEVTDYYTEIALNYRSGVLLMSKDKFNSLSEEMQVDIMEVVNENINYYHDVVYKDYEESAKKIIKDNGVQVIEMGEVDREAFVEAVQPVYEKHEGRFGDLVERIKNVE
ncbi:TRAP transporter substrate-binding protein [Alkalihalobacillus deserti]|uniref:TRAP transporter substrate-binding protein n=1 Tax=Alkalihalobacillus deserti TaxID=2879466 RepID=UPI001D139396|nr:TRAP transporter substrate-binding protein [Alkalihalobacillus deserti]